MNITIDDLMATIGRLHVQVDLLIAENTMLKNKITAAESEVGPPTPAPAATSAS
jgi:hypothetical protein